LTLGAAARPFRFFQRLFAAATTENNDDENDPNAAAISIVFSITTETHCYIPPFPNVPHHMPEG
jgi:hypothetical protein